MQSKLLPLALFLFSLSPSTQACNTIGGIKLTNYGFPDADGTPAYKCHGKKFVPTKPGDRTELGDDSFHNPYASAAASPSQTFLKKCELIYVSLLKIYFRVQDNCSGCAHKQVDLYLIQHNKNVGQTHCEQEFGTFDYTHPLHEVVHDPGQGFETDRRPLFHDGKCFHKVSQGRVFPERDGHVKCRKNGKGEEEEDDVVDDVDGTQDDVDDSGSKDDGDAKARHQGMMLANVSGGNAKSAAVAAEPTKAARGFEA